MRPHIYAKPFARSVKIVAGMCWRLLETDDLCKQILIDAVGRSTKGTRIFKQITGMTMEQYREKAKRKLEP